MCNNQNIMNYLTRPANAVSPKGVFKATTGLDIVRTSRQCIFDLIES